MHPKFVGIALVFAGIALGIVWVSGRIAHPFLPVLALLLLSGLWLAVVQLGGIDALWTTAYGQVLAGKLVPGLSRPWRRSTCPVRPRRPSASPTS